MSYNCFGDGERRNKKKETAYNDYEHDDSCNCDDFVTLENCLFPR